MSSDRDKMLHRKRGKAPDDQGFTLMEMIIVIAILAVLIGLAAVGMNGYFRASDQIRRSEVAETSFYSLQSYINYLKRQGQLAQFEEQIRVYNQTVDGQSNILSEAENRWIIELNYEGGDASAFYANEYYPDHAESEIVYIRLDKNRENKESNPLYPVLAAALQDDDVMANSFLVEYDMSTGVVRSVFYSEDADSLTYHFAANAENGRDMTDCIYRDAASLSGKNQGYYGLTFTAALYEEKVLKLEDPEGVELVNGDRLYLTWQEANGDNPAFTGGGYQLDALAYTVTLYNQAQEVIAVYELPRAEMYRDTTGTVEGTLNYLDDFEAPTADTVAGSTKTAWIGYSDLSYSDAPDGIAGERYYLLLECLDHPFGDNGYDFSAEDTMYASVAVSYGEGGLITGEESVDSNAESVYFAYVENAAGTGEFGIGCSRHLWHIRHGRFDGAYRLIADVDWANIEERARDITFTSTQFEDENTMGLYHCFTGTFTGEKTGEAAESSRYRYSTYRINGVGIYEEANEQVGLFTINQGAISDIMMTDCQAAGGRQVGMVAGLNQGIIENVCVLKTGASGEYYVGGITGYNEGTVRGCTVTTGEKRIVGTHSIGGVAGYAQNTVTDSAAACNVEAVLGEGTEKISTGRLGRYVGGVIGYLEAGVEAENLYSGVLLDTESGMPLMDNRNEQAGSYRAAGRVTGIQAVGGVIGEIENGAGAYSRLYNYARLGVTYVTAEERAARSDVRSRIYLYFGGITGRVYAGNSLENCENHAEVALVFLRDGEPCDAQEIYDYQKAYAPNSEHWNLPRYIGGIAGTNQGLVKDCLSLCGDYGTIQEELDSYADAVNLRELGYVGGYVGGLIGSNEGTLLFTDALFAGQDTGVMQVVVKAFCYSNGGLVGHASTKGIIRNEGPIIKMQGVVASQGNPMPQGQMQIESTGGVAGYIAGGTFTGTYCNDSLVMGRNAGGITGYLAKNMELINCTNTGLVYGRGMMQGSRGAVGGIVGANYGTLTECTNTGSVTSAKELKEVSGSTSYGGNFGDYGGVAGYNAGRIYNCHSRSNAEGSNFIVAYNRCHTGGLVGRNQYNGTSSFGVIEHDGREVVDIPIFIGNAYTADNPYTGGIVGSAAGHLELKDFTYSGAIQIRCARSFAGGTGGIIGILSDDQSMTGCIMSGSITSVSYYTGGLVGNMGGGVIDDTNEVTARAVIAGASYTGGIVGCYSAAKESSHVDIMENVATVSGSTYVGGIAGHVSYGNILDISGRKNSGSVSGTTYVGGLAGRYSMETLPGLTHCENTGAVSGAKDVGGIVGLLVTSVKNADYTLEQCTNTGKIAANKTGSSEIGGVIGRSDVNLSVTECRNEGEIDPLSVDYSMSRVGGLIGAQLNHSFVISSCTNVGEIHATSNVGGMVGIADAAVSEESLIKDCTQEADMYVTDAAGGMIGTAALPLRVENCFYGSRTGEYTIDCAANGGRVGGIVGYSYRSSLTMINCDSYTAVNGRGNLSFAGGLLGRADVRFAIGEEGRETTYCHSYGDIDATGKLSYCGGIVGGVGYGNATTYKTDFAVYGSDHYGRIGEHASASTITGGIIGYISNAGKTEGNAILKDCTQHGQIYQANQNVGGLIGIHIYVPLTLENCHNGVEAEPESGHIYIGGKSPSQIGGLIGYSADGGSKNKKEMRSCNNYGDITVGSITGSVSYIGGLIGYNQITTVIGEENDPDVACFNYGKISADTAVYAIYVGGLVGCATVPNGYYNQEVDELFLYHGVNYGNIGEGMVEVRYAGGIAGSISTNGEIKDCTNLGNLYNMGVRSANNCGCGGILGHSGSGSFLLLRCVNGSETEADQGKLEAAGAAGAVGGIVGGAGHINGGVDSGLSIIECVNYADIAIGGNANYVGGIVGDQYSRNALSIEKTDNKGELVFGSDANYVGGLLGYGTGKALRIGAAAEDGTTDESLACTNYGRIRFENSGLGLYIGGIAGRGNNASLYGAVNTTQINPGDGDSFVSAVGGIVGILAGDSYLQDCRQEGSIRNAVYAGTRYGTGGIVGQSYGSAKIIRCDNGSLEARAAGEADGTIKATVCSRARNLQSVGGIVGCAGGTQITVQECTNYADLTIETEVGNYIGGINGASEVSAVYENCVNYGNILCTGRLNGAGGITGYVSTSGTARFGEAADASLLCVNYGNITFGGTAASTFAGGILGYSSRPVEIYACVNEGDIGSETAAEGKVVGASGIAGSVYTMAGPSVIADCVQKGEIWQVSVSGVRLSDGWVWSEPSAYGSGGILGFSYAPMTIINCVNGIAKGDRAGSIHGISGADAATIGTALIGGIVGHARSGGSLTLLSCTNYADITGEGKAMYVGGLAGRAYNLTLDGREGAAPCVNYGDITVQGDLQYGGGLFGTASGVTIGSESEPDFVTVNHGNVFGQAAERYVGGIVGQLGGTNAVYYCKNEGNVALGNGVVSYVGGIAGSVSTNQKTVLSHCVNETAVAAAGTATDVGIRSGVGGIAGAFTVADTHPNRTVEERIIEYCVNNGNVGRSGAYTANDNAIAGIVGSGSGTIQNCTNLGKVYAFNQAGGIVGIVQGDARDILIKECVNGSAAGGGDIIVENISVAATSIGGILGYSQNHNYNKEIEVRDCTNYGSIAMHPGKLNRYVGGIVGWLYRTNGSITLTLEMEGCKNYGAITNGEMAIGGIIGTTATCTSFVVNSCTNYGTVAAVPKLDHNSGSIGGIAGSGSGVGGYAHCINKGAVTGNGTQYVAGLFGSLTCSYALDCYQLGSVSATGSYSGELAGSVGGPGYMIDCYTVNVGKNLYGSHASVSSQVLIAEHTFWQAAAAGGNKGYLDQTAYNGLCGILGVSPAWSSDQEANALYLISNYRYDPQTLPAAGSFTYYGATQSPATVSRFTFAVQGKDYFAASGMEVWLYESTMTDADILADETGDKAFFHTTVSFNGGGIPSTVTVPIPEEQLPPIETAFKVVIKTLGYNYQDVISTTDTDRVIQTDILTLPAGSAARATFALERAVPDGDVSDGDADPEGSVSGGDGGDSVSGGDSAPGGDNVSGSDNAPGGDNVSGSDSALGSDSVSGGNSEPAWDSVSDGSSGP